MHSGTFKSADVKIVAASVDSVAETDELARGLRVDFPMYSEVDAAAVAEATGAFIQTGDKTFMHATGFVLAPDGSVATAVYATGPIGRMTPSEILRAITFARAQGN